MEQDYYKILEVSRNASADEIDKAYRKLARKYHPDLSDDKERAKVKFQEVQNAYDVLSDAEKRKMYDKFGAGFESMRAGGRQGNPFQGAGGEFNDIDFSQIFGAAGQGGNGLEDIFRQFSGGRAQPGPGQRTRRPTKGRTVEQELTIPFQTAVLGGKANVSIRRNDGKTEQITVSIPAGIEDGKKIRLREQGYPSPNGGPPGDLLVIVKVAKHPYFTRQGRNLELKIPITICEALQGAKVEIPTPKGKTTLSIPAGTSSGRRLRLKGMGVHTSGEPGDMFVELQIVVPNEINNEALELIKKFDRENPTKLERDQFLW